MGYSLDHIRLLVVNSMEGSAALSSSSLICSAVLDLPAVLLLVPAQVMQEV